MQERTQALDELINSHAADIARVKVALSAIGEHDQRIDGLVAALHGGPLPKLTHGAQAVLARAAQEAR
jgi:hypothetical protein